LSDITRLPAPLSEIWDWQLQAACRGMNVSVFFHPADERDRTKAGRIARAKAVCESCPARCDCRSHALRVREPYGIWGGLSDDERAEILGVQSFRSPAASARPTNEPLTRPEF
jgi:WhiB family redox-sensing transcriptional regulator